MQVNQHLLEKYNVPLPRYTSYPTIPFWNETIEVKQWENLVRNKFSNETNGISLYIHLPFCESLCTYCGCNKKITTNHQVEGEYLAAVLKEWQLYLNLMEERPVLRELHLGGGTPTFFSPENLYRLIHSILQTVKVHPDHEFGIEGHPNNTTFEHLKTLFELGFRRVSYGIQDHNPKVQAIINRIQPIENVKKAVEMARSIGYNSVNFDLIYGLPLQTVESMRTTIEQTIALQPDRIAFYSYAHVPWTSKGQRLFDEHDLPNAATKMQLYQLGKEMFSKAGYIDIGMDHFALPTDSLYQAQLNKKLHRNFKGYTTQQTQSMLGLGVSAISDIGDAFAQNEKTLHNYYEAVCNSTLAVSKGIVLTNEDMHFKKYILDISCNGQTILNEKDEGIISKFVLPELEKLELDNLIELDENVLTVTPLGKHFIRNICSAFDIRLARNHIYNNQQHAQFSKAI
jgi:oxygen-independent coproporphyrinogen-3 oxidase